MLALRKWKSLPSTSTPASLSNLPEDIIVSILKRLPVKSILRFKCVSKEWSLLLSTPSFISMHRQATSNNPLNHFLIIQGFDDFRMFLLNVNSAKRNIISLVTPSLGVSKKMETLGCVNGLVCLGCLPPEKMLILWNPAVKQYKPISPPVSHARFFAVGFAYDYSNDDHKIIWIDCLNESSISRPESLLWSGSQVYSSNLDSWTRVQIDFLFLAFDRSSNVTVKGTPYWCGVRRREGNQGKFVEVLVYYDMQTDSFNHVSMPELPRRDLTHRQFVEWKGDLCMMGMSSLSEDKDFFIDFYVYDDIGMRWNDISKHGPIGLQMERPIQCCKDLVILPKSLKRKLILYDPVTNEIKKFRIPGARGDDLDTFSYTESLDTIKGMEQVKSKRHTSLGFFLKGQARVEIAVCFLAMLVILVLSVDFRSVYGVFDTLSLACFMLLFILKRGGWW